MTSLLKSFISFCCHAHVNNGWQKVLSSVALSITVRWSGEDFQHWQVLAVFHDLSSAELRTTEDVRTVI
jgi:hypothetical protein